MSAIASAIAYYSNLIVNPMTITIAFGYGEAGGNPIAGGGGSGQSSFSVIPVSYSTLYNAVKTNFTSGTAVQQVALATLPNTDPTGGGQFTVSTAQALALGIPTGGVTAGGSVGIGVGTYNWTQTGFTGSQSDETFVTNTLGEIGPGLNLVVDDASHINELTIASFDLIFPRLPAGALYVIEDLAPETYQAAWPTAPGIEHNVGVSLENRREM